MGLSLDAWKELPYNKKVEVVEFLKNNCRFDCEEPESGENEPNVYPIKGAITSGGYPMKYSKQRRINIYNIEGIPSFLKAELKEPGTKNRIGGTEAIQAIMAFGGFEIGRE
ncbi:hypothetical protein [Lactococcus allomyrinae]|uniref:Uncharacterized protein n=1 Tax=Lactococcus allomyrinae TaxID=2419773 RepID=A0A387BS54_9LACT|nr:hypothetical protein [Lactococcus allomyrinae]AYG01301.1 hypothetical protein D7I46_09450 [Lactococcus allomyrinae]